MNRVVDVEGGSGDECGGAEAQRGPERATPEAACQHEQADDRDDHEAQVLASGGKAGGKGCDHEPRAASALGLRPARGGEAGDGCERTQAHVAARPEPVARPPNGLDGTARGGRDSVAVMIEEVVVDGTLYALIVRHDFNRPGVHFFTPTHFSQQLGYMSHPEGHRIHPHSHREVSRDVRRTQEVLVIRKGRLRVDLYAEDHRRIESRTLDAGDVILLVQGGHGFEVLEACEMFEVKQGPFVGEEDKVRFTPEETRRSDPS